MTIHFIGGYNEENLSTKKSKKIEKAWFFEAYEHKEWKRSPEQKKEKRKKKINC